eukprot:PhF_6_TR688/c1_g1_i2/m.1083/K07756/IP6K, IHPK; inositol-hexakisphosphate 5-kinase
MLPGVGGSTQSLNYANMSRRSGSMEDLALSLDLTQPNTTSNPGGVDDSFSPSSHGSNKDGGGGSVAIAGNSNPPSRNGSVLFSGTPLEDTPLAVESLAPFSNAVAGHHLMFRVQTNICKEATEREVFFYNTLRKLSSQANPLAIQLSKFVAAFAGVGHLTYSGLHQLASTLEHANASTSDVFSARLRDLAQTSSSIRFILIRDITNGFARPCVLDVKMGVRGYGLDASVKKKRSKATKSLLTTSATLGIRISGMKLYSRKTDMVTQYDKAVGRELTVQTMLAFLKEFFLDQNGRVDEKLCQIFLNRLAQLQTFFEQQEMFHFFTSSLLLTYDANNPYDTAEVTMVDFAYTYTADEIFANGTPTTIHTRRDEMYLVGVKNLRHIIDGIKEDVPEDDDLWMRGHVSPPVAVLDQLREMAASSTPL